MTKNGEAFGMLHSIGLAEKEHPMQKCAVPAYK